VCIRFAALANQSFSIFVNQLPYAASKADIVHFFSSCCAAETMACRMLYDGENDT
jgi:hypothetical protein